MNAEIERVRALLASRPRPAAIADRRIRLDGLSAQAPLPHDVTVTAVEAAGVTAEWTSVPGADQHRVMLYLHGGAYVSGSLVSHRALVTEAGRQANMRTLAIDYRLAPENPYPAGLQDALAAYRFLLEGGIFPENIALAGDSAGGGLTLATMISLRDAGERLPGCAWCISPWTDLLMTGDSMTDKADADPMIQKSYLQEVAALYLKGANAADPMVSPLYADLRGLPPLLIQVGSAETLLDDSLRLARAIALVDGAVTLEVYPDMIHVWHLFHQHVAAGRQALEAAGRFISARTGRDI